ncbi:hypothetical protein HPB47_006420 [Ixodes persulcatus]|uniref:Uncharacterized protein n=1 Tax=Ixodes persulcatus TaxID=34615 RepID=A0AC60PAY2_IXOPE|nr:hypothetical protein HPB47_006420 [Ixodes persulcatus]
MSRLMVTRAVHESRNVERLMSLYDQIETGVCSLEALGLEEKSYGVLLLTVLRKPIPADIGLEYSRKVNTQSGNRENGLRGFLSFFKGCNLQLRARYVGGATVTVQRDPELHRRRRSPEKPNADNRCVFCRTTDHGPDGCASGMSLEDRRAILQQENRCFRCTKKRALVTSMQRRQMAEMCAVWRTTRHRHVQSQRDKTRYASRKGRSDHSREGGDNTTGPSKNQVLLQTAHVWAEGLQGRTLLRLLLDCGSQRTFVRRDIPERLHLRTLGEEDLSIFTFGGNATTNPTKCRRVKLWLQRHADLMMASLEVMVTPMKMEGKTITDVAPDNAVEDGIGLLVRANHYWNVVTGRVMRLSPKLMAVDTLFEWIPQGQLDMSDQECNACHKQGHFARDRPGGDTRSSSNRNRSRDGGYGGGGAYGGGGGCYGGGGRSYSGGGAGYGDGGSFGSSYHSGGYGSRGGRGGSPGGPGGIRGGSKQMGHYGPSFRVPCPATTVAKPAILPERHDDGKTCYICGQQGHISRDCGTKE